MDNDRKRQFIAFVGAFMILLGFSFAVYIVFRKHEVKMPDVRGMSYEDAVSTINAELRKVGIRDASFHEGWIDSAKYAFKVASQTPQAGATVRRGEEVSVYLYIGEGWDHIDRKISYEMEGDITAVFTSMPTSATPGYTVRITTQVLMDADIHLYANGEEIEKTNSDSDGWEYTFVMPSTDVLVTAEWYTKQEMNGEVGG